MLKITAALILICTTLLVHAQNTVNQNDLIENLIENIAEQSEEELDYTNLLEEISELMARPLNINSATPADLQKLYFLNQNQINSLIEYRKSNGEILSIYELQLIPGFSFELIKNIEPLISVNQSTKKIQTTKRAQNLILLRTERTIEKEKGYKTENDNSKYLGNQWKYYSRIHSTIPNKGLEFGITAEKDKGEAFFEKNNSEGFDYYSAHLQVKRDGFLRQINIGDYQVKFGQGVSLWSGLGGRKSSLTTQNSRRYQGIRSYKSADENKFFRGMSFILKPLKNTKLAVFASSKKIDASTDKDTITNFASSIVNTGFHRNANEIAKEKKLSEKVIGSYFLLNLKTLEIGLSYLQYEYSPEIIPQESTNTYYNFKGKNNYNLSLAYQSQINSIHFFGEAARSKSGGLGILQGADIQVHSQLNLEIIYRKYTEDYHAHYASSFSEQSKAQNEEGIYLGVDFHPFPKWTVKAYYDQFEFPWLRYTANSPGNGHEYFAQLEYTPNEKVSGYFRFKQENKAENNNSTPIKYPVEIEKTQYRVHISAKPAANWEIRNRLEFSHFKKENLHENGFLIYQDLIYRFSSIPMNISLRYAIFDTDSYNTRIYAYENDILYAFSVPAYYLQGNRFYLNLNYKIGSKLTLYARYSQTKYSNIESIGSGTSEISGNTKSELKVQLRFKF
nr:helix-hairpin-helix domain-containing protein [uncultured Marinifilum sp.]